MSNVRMIAFFIFGIIVLALCLAIEKLMPSASTEAAERTRLSLLADDSPDAIAIGKVRLEKSDNKWVFVEPNLGDTDRSAIAKLLDALSAARIEDYRTDREIARDGHSVQDFGFTESSPAVGIWRGQDSETISFGRIVPGTDAVYARISGIPAVFTVPAAVKNAIGANVDSLRRRTAVSIPAPSVAAVEFRLPGKPFIKLVRHGSTWRFASPTDGPADKDAVDGLLEKLYAMRSVSFADGMDDSAAGFIGEGAFSIGVSNGVGSQETVTFGAPAGEDCVWMRFGSHGAIASVSAEDAAFCRKCADSLRDVRVFPADEDAIKRISVTAQGEIFSIACGTDGVWKIISPAPADTDADATHAFIARVAMLKRSDLAETDAGNAVSVSVSDDAENYPPVSVDRALFGENPFNSLRSKILLSVKSADIRRIAVRSAAGEKTFIERDAMRNTWNLVRQPGDMREGRQLIPEAVKSLLEAIECVKAEKIMAIAAGPDAKATCGLGKEAFSVSVDFLEQGKIRRITLAIGGKAPGGGRYAAEGIEGALAVLNDETAARLMAPLVN